jgi:hypothetical protein
VKEDMQSVYYPTNSRVQIINHYIKNAGKWLLARWCASMWLAGKTLADLDGHITNTNRGRIGG